MNEEPDYAHLRFYIYTTDKIPMSIMSKETYDLCNSYEPMQYRPENWERFNDRQIKEYEWYEIRLKKNGCIHQIGKAAFLNHDDFLSKKSKIEEEDGFVRWVD